MPVIAGSRGESEAVLRPYPLTEKEQSSESKGVLMVIGAGQDEIEMIKQAVEREEEIAVDPDICWIASPSDKKISLDNKEWDNVRREIDFFLFRYGPRPTFLVVDSSITGNLILMGFSPLFLKFNSFWVWSEKELCPLESITGWGSGIEIFYTSLHR